MYSFKEVPVDDAHPNGIDPQVGSFHEFTVSIPVKVSMMHVSGPFEFNGQTFPAGPFILYRQDGGPLQAASQADFQARYGDYTRYRQ